MVSKTATPKKPNRKSLAAAQEKPQKTIKKIDEQVPQSKKNQKMVKAVKTRLVATPAKGKKNQKPQKEEVVDESSDEAPEELEIGKESDEEEQGVEDSEASGDDVEMEEEADSDSEQAEDEDIEQAEDEDIEQAEDEDNEQAEDDDNEQAEGEEELKEAKPKEEKTSKAPKLAQDDDCETGFGHTILVGNLPPTVTRAEIANLFEPYGKIMSIIFRSKQLTIFFRNRSKSAHTAYVVLDSPEGAAKSYELQNTLIKGKKIYLQDPEKKEGSNYKNTVFIKNLSPNTTEESLRKLFSPCGEINYITLVVFKGYAYVCFRNSDAMKPALKLKDTELDGHKIQVGAYGKSQEETSEGTVFVRNLKTTTTVQTIKEIFSHCGEVEKVVVKQSPKGGYAFVTFKDLESRPDALKLSGTEIDGQQITVHRYNMGIPNFKRSLSARFTNKPVGDFKTQMQKVGSKYLGKKPHPGKFNNTGKFNNPGKFNKTGKFEKPGTFRGVKPTGGIKKTPRKFTPKKV